jgi:hypothetical protein
MAALSFPTPGGQTPVNTYSPTSSPAQTTNGVTYLWDGTKWTAQAGGSSASPATPTVAGTVLGVTNATNSGLGCNALAANTGTLNTAAGVNALAANTSGTCNTAVGVNTLCTNLTGTKNVAVGLSALEANTASNNVAIGVNALCANTTGQYNTATGINALCANTTGKYNTATGSCALRCNQTGIQNTAIGSDALRDNTTGTNNTATGVNALAANTTGACNTATGVNALTANTTGFNTTALGAYALQGYTGSNANNTALGWCAGGSLTSGGNNLLLGAQAGADALCGLTNQSNYVVIGNNSTAVIVQKVTTTVPSDTRWKKIEGDVPLALPFVQALTPIKYQFCDPETGEVTDDRYRYGFKAQEILANEIDPEHPVIIDIRNEEMYGMIEAQMLPVLVNAIKDLAAKNDALQARVEELETVINTLKAI